MTIGLFAGGRLSLVSGTPVPSGNTTGATTIYLVPFGPQGNIQSIWNGAGMVHVPYSELSVAVPATRYLPFDIFLQYSAGALGLTTANFTNNTGTLSNATNAQPIVITSASHGMANNDLVGIWNVGGNTAANGVWSIANVTTNTFELEGSVGNGAYTSGGSWRQLNTARATAISYHQGMLVQTADKTKKFLGTCCTTDVQGETEQVFTNPGSLLLWNNYNAVLNRFILSDTTSHTYTGTGVRVVRGLNSNVAKVVTGVVRHSMYYMLSSEFNFDSGDGQVSTGVGRNRTGLINTSTRITDVGQFRHAGDSFADEPGNEGFNLFALVEQGAATSPDFLRGVVRGVIMQ